MLTSSALEKSRSSNDSSLKTTTWGARLALLALITLLAAGLSLADGKKNKLSKDLDALKGGHNGATVDVIIQFNQAPTAAHHQKVQNKGGVLKTKLDFIKGAHYSVPAEALDALADDPDVAYISPDRDVSGSLDYVTSAVGAPTAWNIYGLDGSGVGVAIIDSGIHNNNDFNPGPGQNRIVYSQDFVGGAGPAADDLYGHGTHVAGIVGGGGKGSNCYSCTRTFKGVAPNANLINLRVLDQNGKSSDSVVIWPSRKPSLSKALITSRSSTSRSVVVFMRAISWIHSARQWKLRGMLASWSSWPPGITAATTRGGPKATAPSPLRAMTPT